MSMCIPAASVQSRSSGHSVPAPTPAALQSEVFARLADVANDRLSSTDTFVTAVLKFLAESLSVAQTHITRVDGDTLHYERVYDRGGINVRAGDAIPLEESYCKVMLETASSSMVVENAPEDDRVATLPATSIAGIGSYTGVPLYRNDGRLYGTLCTLNPEPRSVHPNEPVLLSLAGHIVMQAIETDEKGRRLLTSTEVAVGQVEQRFGSLLSLSPDGILLTDANGTVLMANESAAKQYGYGTPDEMVGMSLRCLIAPEDHRHALPEMRGMSTPHTTRIREYRMLRWDGTHFMADVHATDLVDSETGSTATLAVIRDVTERRQLEEQLRHQALHDSLTGLPNRALLHDRVDQAAHRAQREGTSLALLLFDLDHFKEVNDAFGHRYGDLLLREVAARVCSMVRESDTVARLGGDEFAILLTGTGDEGASVTAKKIRRLFRHPFVVDGFSVRVSVSIGIALYPEHRDGADALLRQADIAMYAAKRSGSAFALYSAANDQNHMDRLQLMNDLHEAIETGQLTLHYQPKANIETGAVHQVEALVRWQHPVHGSVAPDQFIPLAEYLGLMDLLTFSVLNQALDQCRVWHEQGLDVGVAVNLSARSFQDPHLEDMITHLLRTHNVQPRMLELEITESAVMADVERAVSILTCLHDRGVALSIDDFGTGYSSLAHLKKLPLDQIKIDRSFVQDMLTNEDDYSIVRMITDLGHNLGLEVVAEGVENAGTLDRLRLLGCDIAQGYFLSPPLPAPEMTGWIRGH